ncbi:MAG: S26 family signal peptidase [Thermoplasmatota archaeon]
MALGWLERWPRLHRFMTSRDRPYPALREVTGVLVVGLLGIVLLWGGTAQPFPHRPIVVVESASMMHCQGAAHGGHQGDECQAFVYGRFGTIDPGDLVFIHHVGSTSQISTFLAADAKGGPSRYGNFGDVLVYHPDGNPAFVPIIHRAIFFLQIDGTCGTSAGCTFTIPELAARGAQYSHMRDLSHLPPLDEHDGALPPNLGLLNAPQLVANLDHVHAGPEYSGYVMMGDNNGQADQGTGNAAFPARLDWVLGQARGEVPWVGMVNLGFQQVVGNSTWYNLAPSDIKTMFWVVVALFVGVPSLGGFVQRRLNRRKKPDA